jgi:large subunit ribosomal protein LP0
MAVPQRKKDIVNRLCECFSNFRQIIVVQLDNVSTNQIHKAREILRACENKGEMIIGKNTLIKKALKFKTQKPEPSSKDYEDHKKHTQDPRLEALEPFMKMNIGLIFSNDSYTELKTKIEAETISMPARTGVTAPCDVSIPAGPTGIEVGKIDLFHKLNISCKTVKSAIEVVKEVKIIVKGQKVGEGATQMCKLLSIIPFNYSLQFQYVYMEGIILDQSIIEMPEEHLLDQFKNFAGYLTALSLGAGIPNSLSVPHFVSNGFKSLLAIGAESGYSFKQLSDAQNASANAVATGPVTTATASKVVEVAKVEEPEEEEEDMDLGDLFG